jgi:zinc/manganese transport system substrate-binding protein
LKNFRLAILLLAGILAACQSTASRSPTDQKAGLPRVLAAESFLADIAQNVAGDRLKVGTLIPLGVDPHEYQPTPQDVARIADSQVLIVNGVGYEGWLQKTLNSIGGGRLIITASSGLTPLRDPSGQNSQGDPHFWLDPNNVIRYVENIRDGISQVDPQGASSYAANAAAYIDQLKYLDQWIANLTAKLPPEGRLLVTNHESLGYFAARYGFTVVGAVIPSLSSEASPSAQELAKLVDQIRQTHAPAIFLEKGANPKLAQQVSAETGIKVVTDLYLESLSAPDGPAPTYIQMMQYDVRLIVTGCGTCLLLRPG